MNTRNGLGFGWASVSSFRLEPPAWWLIGEKISARNGLGLRFEVGNAGVVVVAWGCDLGVVVAWACRSCGSPPGFADLGLGLPSLFLLFSGVRSVCETHGVCDVSVNLGL
uniref:Uncharacterized protein n=1 Tax=Fagus sylvatica TaxID=28930 RepID=A0A2N9GA75_FAGSY